MDACPEVTVSKPNRSVTGSEVRIKFRDFELQELSNTQCAARVVLARRPGEEYLGQAEGENSPQGQLRSAAEATARALEAATHGHVGLTVLTVKALKKWETILVIVSLSGHVDQRSERSVGSVLTKERPARAAALASRPSRSRRASSLRAIEARASGCRRSAARIRRRGGGSRSTT